MAKASVTKIATSPGPTSEVSEGVSLLTAAECLAEVEHQGSMVAAIVSMLGERLRTLQDPDLTVLASVEAIDNLLMDHSPMYELISFFKQQGALQGRLDGVQDALTIYRTGGAG